MLAFDFTLVTCLNLFVALDMNILQLYSTCLYVKFLRSNWQHSHRFLRQSLQLLDYSDKRSANLNYLFLELLKLGPMTKFKQFKIFKIEKNDIYIKTYSLSA